MRIAEGSRWRSISTRSGCERTAEKRPPERLTYQPLNPVARAISPIVSARGRFATPRRGELEYEEMVWDAALAFGIPGTWAEVNVPDLDVFLETGEVTLPVNVLGWTFTEIEIVYTAGLDPFPDAVKVACAQLVKNAQATPALNVKRSEERRVGK